ncbi:MAG: tetratricopeptide repeat protein [Pirellulaceae bacterium]|nr:tetratricopeptide repeat protein [Pirellulaceae bacterium]
MHSLRVKIFNTTLIIALNWVVFLPASIGQEHIDAADFRQQANRLEKIVLRRPRRGKAFDLWIQHYQDADRLEELVQQLKQRAGQDPDNPSLLMTWGMLNQRTQQRETALELFQQVCQLEPKNYYPRMLLAEELLRQRRAKQAADVLSTALELRVPRQDYLPMAKQLASAYRSSGEPERAREVWSQLSDRFSNDLPVLTEIASYLQNEGDTDTALRLLESIGERSQDPFQKFSTALQIAQLLLRTDQPELATRRLKPLLDQVTLDSWRGENVQSLLEKALLAQGGIEQLVTFWSSRLKEHPDELTTMVRLATALSRADRNQEAEAIYQQAIKQAPERRELHQGLVDLHLSQGAFAAAIEQTKNLTAVAPKDAETWLQLGNLYLQQTNLSDETNPLAIEAWHQMAAIRPTDATLALQASEACLQAATRRSSDRTASMPIPATVRAKEALLLNAAEQFLREAIRRDPKSARYLEYLSELLYRLERREEAIETCLQMAAGDAPASWHEVARLMERFGYLDEAVKASQQAVQADDQNLALRQHAIKLLSQTGAHQQAIDQLDRWTQNDLRSNWLETAIQLRVEVVTAAEIIEQELERLSQHVKTHPQDSYALWTHALLLSATGQPTEASQSMSRAVEHNPDNAHLIRQYASLLEIANDPELAVRQYHHLLKLDPSRKRDDYQRIVDLELRQNHLPAAQEAAAMLVRAAPNDPESHLLKAAVAMRQGDLKTRLSALNRAVEVAPRDLQMRRQYATALRENRQREAALNEAFSCLELAESITERRSILSWILDWARDLKERKWLLDKVRQTQREQANDYNSTLCLIHLLDRMNQPQEALRELIVLQRQYPLDATLLRDLVRLADAANQSQVAVKYQEQLVRVDQSPIAMEQLARLYRQNNQLDAAIRIWDDLITNTTSPNQTIAVIDRLLELKDVFQAQRFAEAGLAQFPNNWRLAYRSGLLHIAMSQPTAARKSMAIVLGMPATPTATSQQAVREYHLLTTAVNAFGLFQTIADRIEQHGARHPKTMRNLFAAEIIKPNHRASLIDTQIFAAVAMLALSNADDGQTDWISQVITNTNATDQQLQVATLATWAGFRPKACRQAMDRLRQTLPDNAIPSLINVLNPPTWDQANEIPANELQHAFQWLQENERRMARDIKPLYVARLFYHPDGDSVQLITRQALETAKTFAEVTDLTPLVQSADNKDLNRLFFENVDRHLPRDASRVKQQQVWAAITCCMTITDWNQSSHANVTLELLELMLSTSRLSSTPRSLKPSPSTVGSYLTLKRQLSQGIDRQLKQSRGLNRSKDRTEPHQHYRIAQQKQQQILELETSGAFRINSENFSLSPPVIATQNQPKWFPTPTPQLGLVHLGLIKNIALQMHAAEQLPRLINHLKQSTLSSDIQDRQSFDFAQICATWYAQQEEEAVAQLTELAQNRTDENVWRFLLVRAHLERNDLPVALATLNSIPEHDKSWQLLRTAIAANWSKQALHRNLEGHTGAISSIAYHTDNRRLASASIDHTVRIWDTVTGELQHTLTDHDDIVLAVAFSPSGNLLASAGYDQQIRIWNAKTLQRLATMTGHTSTIRALAFAPDGEQLASAGDDSQIRLWDLKTFRQTSELTGDLTSITTIAYSPTGRNIASGDLEGKIVIWDRQTATAGPTLNSDQGSVRSIVYTIDDEHFISGTDDRMVQLWTRSADQWLAQAIPTNAGVRDVSFHLPTKRLAIGLHNNSVVVWNPESATEQFVFKGHDRRVLTVCFAPDGRRAASAGFDGTIKIWNTLLPSATSE